MSLHAIYLELSPADIAYVKFIFESYEEVGIIRTVDRTRAIIVLLVMTDFLAVSRAILQSIKNDVQLKEIVRPAGLEDDWLMAELNAASDLR